MPSLMQLLPRSKMHVRIYACVLGQKKHSDVWDTGGTFFSYSLLRHVIIFYAEAGTAQTRQLTVLKCNASFSTFCSLITWTRDPRSIRISNRGLWTGPISGTTLSNNGHATLDRDSVLITPTILGECTVSGWSRYGALCRVNRAESVQNFHWQRSRPRLISSLFRVYDHSIVFFFFIQTNNI